MKNFVVAIEPYGKSVPSRERSFLNWDGDVLEFVKNIKAGSRFSVEDDAVRFAEDVRKHQKIKGKFYIVNLSNGQDEGFLLEDLR